VSDPFSPVLKSEIRLGGMVSRTPHPSRPGVPLNGGPQMVELSRDCQRAYFSNSLFSPWDRQFYPDGIEGWMVKADVQPDGTIALDEKFFVDTHAIGMRPHQIHLEGGDASSDSYCFP
jgi:selenium-binding protein 1